jgi:FAD dependent oxidoreductase TIGR03364
MVWPVGQPVGALYQRAMRSRAIWLEMAQKAGFWAEETGSLHLTYTDLEAQIAQEYVQAVQEVKSACWLDPNDVAAKSPAAVQEGLRGALWSADEVIVDPRQAIAALAAYLEQHPSVTMVRNRVVSRIEGHTAYSGQQQWGADRIFVASGADFETLYPDLFAQIPITKCKLQMMRLVRQPDGWRIGPPLCSSLSFIHYKGFDVAPSVPALRALYQAQSPELMEWGIHVMVSQHGTGELVIGDSHEYGLSPSPFDQTFINDLIVNFLKRFAQFRDWGIESCWQGIYPKMTNGATEYVHAIDDVTTIVNGVGGAGMTLSFGLAEEVVAQL